MTDPHVVGGVRLPAHTGVIEVVLPISGAVCALRPPTGHDRLLVMGGFLPERRRASVLLRKCAIAPLAPDSELPLPDESVALVALLMASIGAPTTTLRFVCPAGCGEFGIPGSDLSGLVWAARQDAISSNEVDGFTWSDVRYRHITVAENESIEEAAVISTTAAERLYAELAAGAKVQSWSDASELSGVLDERWRHGGADLVAPTMCPKCRAEWGVKVDPRIGLLSPSAAEVLVQAENIGRVLRWPVGDILDLVDPVRAYYNDRAAEIADKQAEEAARARRR